MSEIEVALLADHPEFISVLAGWLFAEWGHRSPDGSRQGMQRELESRMNRQRLPVALVAHRSTLPLGTVSLRVREMEIRPQYEHWLGSFLVHQDFRRLGVGRRLIESAIQMAPALGIRQLYLYTRNAYNEAYYARLGWRVVERLDYRSRPAVIMGVVIGNPAGTQEDAPLSL